MKQQYQCLSLVAGANLKRLIREQHMTQEDAAEKLLLSDGRCVRRLIHDGIKNIDEIQRIADALGVPLAEMLKNPLD
ncbi:MAG: helix-turn-helix transcriptional regulator [Clostridia bacterium]|nr:helix-turn-helix transcriptional regulator [Clostridia bacterium]